jgi:hypothetical protein
MLRQYGGADLGGPLQFPRHLLQSLRHCLACLLLCLFQHMGSPKSPVHEREISFAASHLYVWLRGEGSCLVRSSLFTQAPSAYAENTAFPPAPPTFCGYPSQGGEIAKAGSAQVVSE